MLIAVLSVAVVVLSGRPAWAAKPQVLPNGQVVVAEVAPSNSTVPVNGELRGPDSQAVVSAVAWPYEADGYVANTGNRLVAFTVQLTEPTSYVSPFDSTSTPPALSLVVDGSPQPLDTQDISSGVGNSSGTTGTGTESYVASVPNTTKSVNVSMTDASYTQAFSLWRLERTTPASAVLYDDPTSSSVTEQLGITKTISIHDPTLGTTPAEVFVASAMLSAFNPANTDIAAPADHAYLVLSMVANSTNAEWNSSNYLLNITPLPGGAVTFTSAKGRKYQAMRSNVTQPDLSTSDDGMLDARYTFLVPDTTHGGIVSIGPATTSGQTYENYLISGPIDTLVVGGPARFSVGFPNPPVAQRQPKPPWEGEPVPPTGLPGASNGGSSGLPVGGAVAVVVLVVIAILVVRQRLSASPAAKTTEDEPERMSEPVSEPVPDVVMPVVRDAPEPAPGLAECNSENDRQQAREGALCKPSHVGSVAQQLPTGPV